MQSTSFDRRRLSPIDHTGVQHDGCNTRVARVRLLHQLGMSETVECVNKTERHFGIHVDCIEKQVDISDMIPISYLNDNTLWLQDGTYVYQHVCVKRVYVKQNRQNEFSEPLLMVEPNKCNKRV